MSIAPVEPLLEVHDQFPTDNSAESRCSKLITPDQRCTNVLDTEGSPKWCKKCRATYRREYEALKDQVRESRGFARGVTALRTVLVTEFERLGSGMFSGYEIAELIRRAEVKSNVDAPA